MIWHPTDEELVLFLYRDESGHSAARIDAHLPACPACRAAYAALADLLRAADDLAVPEPGDGFERALWVHATSAAARAAGPAPIHRPLPMRAWAIAAGLAAAVSSAVLLAALPYAPFSAAGDRHPPVAVEPDLRERVLLTAIDGHLAQTEVLLVELLNAPDEPANLAFERAAADDLVASGRLYRETARQTGAVQVTEVLDDLEAVLVEVARGPDRVDPVRRQELRLQIDEYGLLFKVRAVGDRIRSRQDVMAGHVRTHELRTTITR